LITDVFTSRPLLCTIHHLINFALVRVENAQSCPRCLTKDIRVSGPSGGEADGLLSADFVAKVGAEQLASKNAQQSNLNEWIFESILRTDA
jgi:hypothetical protein